MRGNRRLSDISDIIEKHQLSTAPPAADSLFWKMWRGVQDVATDTLALPYLQGINAGTLDPNQYGGYNVADAYYCFEGADAYQTAVSKTTPNTPLNAFLSKKLAGYQRYNATFPDTWHVSSAASISPPQVTKDYAEYEGNVAARLDPIYCLIVMIPCEYLWAWLAGQMNPPQPSNVYGEWITENNDPSGAYAMGNFLDSYMTQNPGVLDTSYAQLIYGFAQIYEYQNFAAATGTQPNDAAHYGIDKPAIPPS